MYACLSVEYGMQFYCYFDVIIIRKVSFSYRE